MSDIINNDMENAKEEKQQLKYVPWGITSLADYRAYQMVHEETMEALRLIDIMQELMQNIVESSEVTNKKSALQGLLSEFMAELEDTVDSVKESTVSIFKDNNGVWKWIGVFSNNIIDRQDEILTSEAHKDNFRALESGEWPYPELWLYHSPLARVGKAEWGYFDESTGMSLHYGYFYDGMEKIAEELAQSHVTLGMSHGMPIREIRRDPINKNHITRYRDTEVTILQIDDAANLFTSFDVANKGINNMSELKKKLARIGISEEAIERMTSRVNAMKEVADELGLETKQEEEPKVESSVEVKTEPVPEPEVVDGDALKDAITALVSTIAQGFQSVGQSISTLETRVKALQVIQDENASDVRKEAVEDIDKLDKQKPFDASNQMDNDDPLRNSKPHSQYGDHPLSGL